MRFNDLPSDRAHTIGRALRSLLGVGIILLGVFVFKTSPEHGATFGIVLATIGGIFIDAKLVKPSNIKRILEK